MAKTQVPQLEKKTIINKLKLHGKHDKIKQLFVWKVIY